MRSFGMPEDERAAEMLGISQNETFLTHAEHYIKTSFIIKSFLALVVLSDTQQSAPSDTDYNLLGYNSSKPAPHTCPLGVSNDISNPPISSSRHNFTSSQDRDKAQACNGVITSQQKYDFYT
jgi:hypothetical protein